MARGSRSWTLILPVLCAVARGDELSERLHLVRVGDPVAWEALGVEPNAATWLRLLHAASDARPEVRRGALVACGWSRGGPPEVDRVLEHHAARPGPAQEAALISLAARGQSDALLRSLVAAVQTPEPQVALDRLTLLRDSAAVGALCREVLGAAGAAPEVQLAVLRRLGELGRSELLGWSKQFSRQAGDAREGRRLACVALVAELRVGARERDEAALSELLRYAVDLDDALYPDAIAGLRLFEQAELLLPLRSHLLRGGSRHRFRLFAAIKELGLARGLRTELEEIALDPDEGPWIRQGALDALPAVPEARGALARLLRAPRRGPDELALARQAVVQLATAPPTPDARQAVEGLLGAGERTLRIEVLRTLAAWGAEASAPAVRQVLLGARSPSSGEREALLEAARACGLHDAETVRVVRDWTREAGDPGLAQALLRYAEELPELQDACSLLIELLDFRSLGQELLGSQVRADAAQALTRRTEAQIRYDPRVQPFDARGRERWLEWWRSQSWERPR